MPENSIERCKRYRRHILEISQQVEAAHVAPAFSCVEIVDALYNEVMRPQDIFIMSKGHGCLAQYVVLEDLGKLPPGDLDYYCDPRGVHGAHPDYDVQRGIHASTGSLGHGLGIAAGQALAERLKKSDARVYCLLSDGECQEGSTWEAAMVAANLRLDNLVALVDCNDFGGMDRMSEVHPALHPLSAKFAAFGWEAVDTEGHVSGDIVADLGLLVNGCPNALVCHTTKGKGVSFMEDAPIWHYRNPSADEYEQALREIG
jgi:transketolase